MVDDVENVLIFVCDSLRWGFLPEDVRSRGVTFKTVAQSTYSPPSFATLSTGLYPPEHGVEDFGKSLAEGVDTVYEIDGLDATYYNEGRIRDPFFRVFGLKYIRTIADLASPFFYIERDPTTHAPYMENPFMSNEDVKSYFADPVIDWESIKADYREAIRISLDRLDRRQRTLERLGLSEDTLVILTGDHGELFGEYGDILHTMPTSPELVYVPTVFLHPSIDADSFSVNPDSQIIEHVDVVTTALTTLGFADALPTRGVDLFSEPRSRAFGYTYTKNYFRGRNIYASQSLWWRDGGFVQVENPSYNRLGYLLYRLLRGTGKRTLRRNIRQLLRHYWRDSHQFGDIGVSKQEARDILTEFISTRGETVDQQLDNRTREQLEELGYLS